MKMSHQKEKEEKFFERNENFPGDDKFLFLSVFAHPPEKGFIEIKNECFCG